MQRTNDIRKGEHSCPPHCYSERHRIQSRTSTIFSRDIIIAPISNRFQNRKNFGPSATLTKERNIKIRSHESVLIKKERLESFRALPFPYTLCRAESAIQCALNIPLDVLKDATAGRSLRGHNLCS
jgi:hypothetical protein